VLILGKPFRWDKMSKSGKQGELDGERSARNERNSTARTRFNGRDFNGRRKRSGAPETVVRTRRPAPLQNPLTLFYYKRKILQSGRRTISALSSVFRAKRRRRRRGSDFLIFFFLFAEPRRFFGTPCRAARRKVAATFASRR